MKRIFIYAAAALIGVWLVAASVTLWAQDPAGKAKAGEDVPFNVFNDLGGLSGLGGIGGGGGNEITLSAEFTVEKGDRNGKLSVHGVLAPNWHVYSVTQPDGGPIRTEIKLKDALAGQVELTGPFQPDQKPLIHDTGLFPVPSEEHYDKVTWTAPVRLAADFDPAQTSIQVDFKGQVCNDEVGCIDVKKPALPVQFAGYYEAATPTGEYRAEKSHATIRGQVEPQTAAPGDTVRLILTAEPDPNWHIYAYAQRDPEKSAKPTLIVLSDSGSLVVGTVTPSEPPTKEESGLPEEPYIYYYEQPVRWTIELRVPPDMKPGQYRVAGEIGYQTCTSTKCDLPTGAQFQSTITVAKEREAGQVPLAFTPSSYETAAQIAASQFDASPRLDLSQLSSTGGGAADSSFIIVLMMAFAAGFILNFMPCVLPVIGLKIMAFVQQSGASRGRVFMLNFWYTLGLMSVFIVLATLAVGFGLKWGAQFNNATFNIVLTSVVFAFALSFLGVWEIPLPGFATSGKISDLAQGEGATGAFFKGVLTTVLATPCGGPLLIPAVTWATSQPPLVTYTTFAFVGLGMGFPYLLIGAFPNLVAFLPKPGAWMDTFKHIMGFVLLGTVVLLLTFVPSHYVVPLVAFLMGLWAMLWWIGRVPLYEELPKQLRAWGEGAVFATLVGLISFGWLLSVMEGRFRETVEYELSLRSEATGGGVQPVVKSEGNELPWQPYSLGLLERAVAENKTVFIDFTAPT